MRQFMSGMKNYLVKHGEKGFYKEIERERSKVQTQFFYCINILFKIVCFLAKINGVFKFRCNS